MKFRTATIVFLLVAFSLLTGTAQALVMLHPLESPNGDFKIVIASGPLDQTSFAVFYKGNLVLHSTNLGLELVDDFPIPSAGISREWFEKFLASTDERPLPERHEGTSGPHPNPREYRVPGKAAYNESVVVYIGLMKILFRAYDGGIAYRYEIAPKVGETMTIKNELTEFIFPDDYPCTVSKTIEGRQIIGRGNRPIVIGYQTTLSKVEKGRGVPLRIEIPNGLDFDFGTMRRAGFEPMQFQPGRQRTGTFNNLYDNHGRVDRTGTMTAIAPMFDSNIVIRGTGRTVALPWRILSVAPPSADAESMLQGLFAD